MSLIKRKPDRSSPVRSMLTDMLDVERFFGNDPFFKNLERVPSTNIREQDDRFEVQLAVPGMDKKDFKVEIANNILCISAEKKVEKTEEKENYTRREFSYDSFSRSFELPATINESAIDAQYKDGILTLTLPKKQEAIVTKRKEITVA
jgi:HSP20 family protein